MLWLKSNAILLGTFIVLAVAGYAYHQGVTFALETENAKLQKSVNDLVKKNTALEKENVGFKETVEVQNKAVEGCLKEREGNNARYLSEVEKAKKASAQFSRTIAELNRRKSTPATMCQDAAKLVEDYFNGRNK